MLSIGNKTRKTVPRPRNIVYISIIFTFNNSSNPSSIIGNEKSSNANLITVQTLLLRILENALLVN